MEPNVHYALHDSNASPPTWAARVRLTPELLDKLRQSPEQVLLQLNVANTDGHSTSSGSSKKTSLMTVKQVGREEQYELLSFPEDPGINHVCSFRRSLDGEVADGYRIYKTGAIHQKLLVQRLLDDTEKDRIKDKHAKSVLASKSRSSKLIDSDLTKPAKRQRHLPKRLSIPMTSNSASSITADHKPKLVLPSALTEEKTREAKEKIEKGAEAKVSVLRADRITFENDAPEEATPAIGGLNSADARSVESHDLFSSDSDNEDLVASVDYMMRTEEKQETSELLSKQSIPISKERGESDDSGEKSFAKNTVAAGTDVDANAQVTEPNAVNTTIKMMHFMGKNKSAINGGKSGVNSCTLKAHRPTTSDVEVKRARVRSALVSDRVKKSRLPNLAFFPSAVGEICHRLAHYHGRSVILDENDYKSFVETYVQFLHDWEVLDKAYSIEIIKTEGVHLHVGDIYHEESNASIQASSSRKEDLLFVRDAMASIQKILVSIQASIDRFDMKLKIKQ